MNISKILKEKGITQIKLATDLEIAPSLLSRYLTSKLEWPPEVLKKVADYLEIDYSELSEIIYNNSKQTKTMDEQDQLKKENQDLRDQLNQALGENRILRKIAGIDIERRKEPRVKKQGS